MKVNEKGSSSKSRGVALVTGASRGIGKAIAQRLARDGWIVAITYSASAVEAEAVVKDMVSSGATASCHRADVRRQGDVKILFEELLGLYGRVDAVVSNAGVNTDRPLTVTETSVDEFDRIFEVNARGTFLVLSEASKVIASGGRIVNISTSVTKLNLPGYAAYAGSKAAVETFTRILAKELRGRDVTVNAVAPGPTDTDLFRQGKTEEDLKRFASMSPLGRLGKPEDISAVVAFLLSKDSGWVNGQVIPVNGGLV